MALTTENSTRQWGFVLRGMDGRIVGYGRLAAENHIEAVSTIRMVHLDDVIPAISLAVVGGAPDMFAEPLNTTGGAVPEWSTSNPDGA